MFTKLFKTIFLKPFYTSFGEEEAGDFIQAVIPAGTMTDTPVTKGVEKEWDFNKDSDDEPLEEKPVEKKEVKEEQKPAEAEKTVPQVTEPPATKPAEVPVAPKTFAELFPELAEHPSLKDASLEDGKKLLKQVLQERDEFSQAVTSFEEDKKQIVAMSELMNSNPKLAEAVWTVIERIKAGMDPYPKEGEEIEVPPAVKMMNERIARIEADNQKRQQQQDVEWMRKKISEVKTKFGEVLKSDEDLNLIADLAIINKTDDLDKIADKFVQRMNKHGEAMIEKAKATFKESVRKDIIKEYLAMKEEDRNKFIEPKKPTAPAPERKSVNIEDGSARRSFARSIAEAFGSGT